MRAWLLLFLPSLAVADPWKAAPIATEPTDEGCHVRATGVAIDLSVDGTPNGTFVRHVTGAKGDLTIAPGHRSSAHITVGPFEFATGVELGGTKLLLAHRPPTLGGVIDLGERASFHAVGGDATQLVLQPAAIDDFAWVVAPTFQVKCDELGPKRWAGAQPPESKTWRAIDPAAKLALRATATGPVVANVTAIKNVLVLETKGALVKIQAAPYYGLITAWVDEASLAPPPAPTPADRGGGGGMGRMSGTYVSCEPGAPLVALVHDKLYTVGSLALTPDPMDVHLHAGKLSFEFVDAKATPYLRLKEELRSTGHYWNDGVIGELGIAAASCSTKR